MIQVDSQGVAQGQVRWLLERFVIPLSIIVFRKRTLLQLSKTLKQHFVTDKDDGLNLVL